MPPLRHLLAFLALAFSASLALPAAPLPPDADYVRVSADGHLELNGQRVRYWGAVTNHVTMSLGDGKGAQLKLLPSDTAEERTAKIQRRRAAADLLAQRLTDLGFNMVRTWDNLNFTKPYTVGDGSEQDQFAYAMNALDQKGIKVWFASQGNNLGSFTAADVAILDDPATAADWQAAVTKLSEKNGRVGIRSSLFNVWDARTQALRLQRMRQIADFPNHYKGGLRIADDPQVVVWELSNEEWWFTTMINGRWQGLPKYFRDGLQARWQAFLVKKYGTEAELTKAWQFLMPGESLDKATISIAPLANKISSVVMNDVNPAALAALTSTAGGLTRDQFTRQRGADVNEFFLGMIVTHKLAERDFFKTLGKSSRLSPLVFDTGDGYRIQTVYLQQQADAVTMCTYLDGYAKDRQQPRFPWYSYLDEAPRMAHDVPWAEIGRVPGKPFFLYETQAMNPSKYRAEFPYRLLALGAIQDWDIINWHCLPRPVLAEEERPYDKAMELAHGGFQAEGFHFRFDEVQSAAMRTAAHMFRTGAFKPVEKPTTVTFGSRSLYDPASMDYGKSFGEFGERITPTTYRYGLYMKVDPTRTDDLIEGPSVLPRLNEANPMRPTSEIAFDWQRSHLVMDAPSAVSYTGFYAQHGGPVRFANGITLDKVTVTNPEGMVYPVGENEKFISFGAVAQDGLPLDKSRHVLVSLVSTSFNTGYKINEDNVATAKKTDDIYRGMVTGKAPVMVARAGATLTAPQFTGMKYRLLDWHMNEIGQGVVKDGVLPISADQPTFSIELTR